RGTRKRTEEDDEAGTSRNVAPERDIHALATEADGELQHVVTETGCERRRVGVRIPGSELLPGRPDRRPEVDSVSHRRSKLTLRAPEATLAAWGTRFRGRPRLG